MDKLKHYIDHYLPLSESDWQSLSNLFHPFSLPRNTYFAQAGRLENHIGFLTNGIIRAFYRSPDGTEYNKTFFEPCEFVGAYTSLTTRQNNQINLQALTDAQLLIADYSHITALFDAHPKIERLCRLLAEYFYAYKEKREIELVLLDAAQRYELFKQEYPGLENQIAQYHIASYLGIQPVQLSRIRAQKK